MESLEIKRQLGDKRGISDSLSSLGIFFKDQGKIEDAEKLYLESLEIRRQLGNKSGISASLNNLGVLYNDQGKFEDAERLYLESLEIKKQLGDKKGISASLNNLGVLYKGQSKIEEAEKFFLESLEMKKQLGDKKGISQSLNNLGVLAFEKGDEQNAKELFAHSISVKRELKAIVSILASIHSAFHLFNNEERLGYLLEIAAMEKKDFAAKEKCWLADIELIEKCLNGEVVTPAFILSETCRIIDFAKDAKLFDIDDLPVEAFFIASKKLLELNEQTDAINLAKQALDWIGDRKTLRKNELEKIFELDKPMQNKK
jgi:tetratricopeptide (TPR) repeat protein